MTDETIVQEQTAQADPSAETLTTDTAVQMIPLPRFNEVNEQYKALKQQLEAQTAAQEKAERERLENTAQFEQLYKETLGKYDQTAAELESLRTANEDATAALTALWESKKHIVPKHTLTIAEKLPLTERLSWLAENEKEFAKPSQGTPQHTTLNGTGKTKSNFDRMPKVKF